MKAAMPRLGALLLTVLLASSALCAAVLSVHPPSARHAWPWLLLRELLRDDLRAVLSGRSPLPPFQGMVPAPKSKEGEKGAAQGKAGLGLSSGRRFLGS